MIDRFNTKDERWVHGLLAVLFALLAFQLGAWRETDAALSTARQKFAEWAQQERVKIAAEEKKAAQAELDRLWPCKGFGLAGTEYKCVLRERR